MKKSIKNFMNKPITHGGYLKLCGISLIGSVMCFGYAYYKTKKFMEEVDQTVEDDSELDELNDYLNVEIDE